MPQKIVEVTSERLLLVEGQDEVNLLTEILSAIGVANVQLLDCGGKDQFTSRLEAALGNARTKAIDLVCLGVIRDADLDFNGAFDSICGSLRNNDLPVPIKVLDVATGNPCTTVFIAPDNHNLGAIEQLCWDSVSTEPAGSCVEQYIDCLTDNSALSSTDTGKSKVHAYLASMVDPVASVGIGAKAGYWKLDHSAFDDIKQFIQNVSDA